MPRPCALYARFSSDRQNPKSCDDQLREARAYAQAKGWKIVGQFHDDGVSGTKGRQDRGGWDKLLAFIEAGGLAAGGIVLTWDIDRWSRDWADGMIEALRLHKLGVDLADTKDGVLEQAGLAGKILLTLKVAGADEFIQKLRRNVKRGLDAKRGAGYWTCPPPFGFTTERTDGGSVLVPDENAEWAERIYQLLDEGLTPAAVARKLNHLGVQTVRRSKWSPATIRLIARSPVYVGKIAIYNSRAGGRQRSIAQVPAGEVRVIEGRHQPLVDPDLWHRVQKRLEMKHRGPNALRSYPLSGLVICDECGNRCQVTGGEWPYRNYRCRPYGLETSCKNRRIVRVQLLEDAVSHWAHGMAEDKKAIGVASRRLTALDQAAAWRQSITMAPAQRKVDELTAKQEKLLEALYAGGAPTLINERLQQVQVELENAKAALDTLGDEIDPLSPRDLARVIQGALAESSTDLAQVTRYIEWVRLPADPDTPPLMRAFGKDFELEIPRTPKDRTKLAAKRT